MLNRDDMNILVREKLRILVTMMEEGGDCMTALRDIIRIKRLIEDYNDSQPRSMFDYTDAKATELVTGC